MPAMHRDHRCLSTGSAQLLYIKEASSGHTHYGLHLYRLRNSKKSDEQNQQHHHQNSLSSQQHRFRSAERAESRLSDRTTTSAASSTLDRSSSKHKMDTSDIGNESTTSSRTLDRASQRSCSANENPSDHHHHQLLHHNGAVWLGICGRGIDIYEAISSRNNSTCNIFLTKIFFCVQEEDSFTKTVRATFQWPNIGKLCFEVEMLFLFIFLFDILGWME